MKNYLDKENILTIKQFTKEFPELAEKCRNAKRYLFGEYIGKYNFNEDEEFTFVVIKVEGYWCVARIEEKGNPYILDTDIAPFDENKIYPIQGLTTEYKFIR